jgi:hypothetical protein
MNEPRPPGSANRVEAAADRVMRLWSMIRLRSDTELAALRVTVLQELAEQTHLTEDELVVVGLKYLHQHVGLKKK